MPTRSAAKRANANARYIANRAAHPSSNAARWVSHEDGSFTDVTARVFALSFTTHPVGPERCAEVSWPLAAELMNRAAVTRSPKRRNAPMERYGQVGPPPEYFSVSEVRERAAKSHVIERW